MSKPDRDRPMVAINSSASYSKEGKDKSRPMVAVSSSSSYSKEGKDKSPETRDRSLALNSSSSFSKDGKEKSTLRQSLLPPAPILSTLSPVELFRQRATNPRTRGCCGLWSCMRHYGFMNFLVFHVLYFIVIGILGTLFIYSNEDMPLVDAIFQSFSTLCLGGLSTVDMSQLKTGTYIVMIIMMELGGAIFTTVFVLLVRRYFLRRAHREMKSEVYVPVTVHSNSNSTTGVPNSSLFHDPYHLLDSDVNNNIEYTAMGLLLKIILGYVLVSQIVTTLIIGSYLGTNGRDSLIASTASPDGSRGPMNVWLFAAFVSVSAFCNCGLVPLGSTLVPFREHPAVLIPLLFNIVLGNTAFPVVLRALVVLYSKLPWTSPKNQFLSNFILTKSRTIYTHLFSATYTRVLFVIFTSLLLAETAMFLITELNNPEIEGIDFGSYFLNALFQSGSTRTAGMNTVNLHQLNPGLLVLMILSMYIVTYPLLFAIRKSDTSTKNQIKQMFTEKGIQQGILPPSIFQPGRGQEPSSKNWENEYNMVVSSEKAQAQVFSRQRTISGLDIEQARREMEALNNFEETLDQEEIKLAKQQQQQQQKKEFEGKRKSGITQKLMKLYTEVLLLRDITWVYLATLIICLAEGRKLTNPYVDPESSIFEVIFEVVSAFGTVGFTMGYKDYPYSFSGTLTAVSKITLVVMMILGRHRGLPSSTDPAVIPSNYASLRRFRARRRAFVARLERTEDEEKKKLQPLDPSTELTNGSEGSKSESDSGEGGGGGEGEEEGEGGDESKVPLTSRMTRWFTTFNLRGTPSPPGGLGREEERRASQGVVLTPSGAGNGFLAALSDDGDGE